MENENALLVCRELSMSYAGTPVLNKIDLSIPRGRIIGLLGPNGSGKTTLMKLCNGLLQPVSGSITIGGWPVGVETKKIVSFLPERTYFMPWMRVKNLVKMFRDFYEDFDEARAHEMMHMLEIDEQQPLKNLSKGTKEKVQLILVMSRKADLYMLDEPIGGVDPAAREYILHTVLANYGRPASLLISTHLVHDIEPILDDAIFIRKGNLLRYDSVAEIRKETGLSLEDYFKEEYKCC